VGEKDVDMNGSTNEQTGGLRLTGRRKRLFVFSALFSTILVFALAVGLIYLLMQHAEAVKSWLILFVELLAVLFVLSIGLSLSATVWYILTDRQMAPPMRATVQSFLLLVLPLATFVGKIAGKSRDDIQASFIAVGNAVAERSVQNLEDDEILVLLPRCMQWADCIHKVTQDVSRCKQCGNCALGDILDAIGERGIHIYVSTGGTQARRFVKEIKPHLIVAVACEREIAEGIRDVRNIPVIGVVNQRPQGPCYNTDVDVDSLKEAIDTALQDREV